MTEFTDVLKNNYYNSFKKGADLYNHVEAQIKDYVIFNNSVGLQNLRIHYPDELLKGFSYYGCIKIGNVNVFILIERICKDLGLEYKYTQNNYNPFVDISWEN